MDAREELVRWLFEAVWTGGATAAAADRIDELTFHYGGASRRMTGTELGRLVEGWRDGFPDLRFEVVDLVSQADRVATRCRLSGTQQGEWRGRPPTGLRMDVDAMLFFRFEGDRLVEVWEVDDAARRERQLAGDELTGDDGTG